MLTSTRLPDRPVSGALYRCAAVPGQRPYAEPHDGWSASYVQRGSFGCACRGRRFELVPGAVLTGRPGDEYTCNHDHHAGGDDCLAFFASPELADGACAGAVLGVTPHQYLLRRRLRRELTEGIARGGRDNGPPGPRPDYGADYYAAFGFDPDGHNLEAVCHARHGVR